jgi:hypothetical protein
MSALLSVGLSCIGKGLTMRQSPVQGVLSKYLKGFIVSEANSEAEQVTGRNQ